MGYNKSSKYANIACALFILYAVVILVLSIVALDVSSGIGSYDREEEDVAYFIVGVFSALVYPVICIITAYMIKKRKKSAILWLAIFASMKMGLSIEVSYATYGVPVIAFSAVGSLLICSSFVIFAIMLFAAAYNKNKIVSKLFVLPAALYMPGKVCTILVNLMTYARYNPDSFYSYYRDLSDWSLLDYLDFSYYLDFSDVLGVLIKHLLPGIIVCSLLLVVSLYLKNFSAVVEKQDNIRPVEVIGSAEKIKEYKDMLDSGIITQDEFDSIKKQLL